MSLYQFLMSFVESITAKFSSSELKTRSLSDSTSNYDTCVTNSLQKLRAEKVGETDLKIFSGVLLHHGCLKTVPVGGELLASEMANSSGGTGFPIPTESGVSSKNYIVCRFTIDANSFVTSEWVILCGIESSSTPTAPSYTVGDIRNGYQSSSAVDDCPLYEVVVNASGISSFTRIPPIWQIETSIISGSSNPVTSSAIATALSGKIGTEDLVVKTIQGKEGNFVEFKAGNVTATMATIEHIESAYMNTSAIEANYGDFEYLNAHYASLEDLDLTNANIVELEAEDARITSLLANKASITSLQAVEAEIDSLDTTYATIDLANVEDGVITTAMIGEGVVDTAQIADGSITDAKIVELTANKITAGTLDVERLVLTDEDTGEKYVMTYDADEGEMVSTKIHGDVIEDRTITADKIVANAITANEIASNTITANEIASNTITASQIESATITGTQIAGGTITASHLETGTICVGNMPDSDQSNILNSNIHVGSRNLVWNVLCGKYTSGTVSSGTLTNISKEAGYKYSTTADPNDLIGFIAKNIGQGTITISGLTSLSTLTYYYTFRSDSDTVIQSQSTGSCQVENGEFSFVLTAPENGTVLHIGLGQFPYVEDYTVSYVKIENGNKATDWTPAPEDVDANINTVSVLAGSAQTAANEASAAAQAVQTELGNKVDTSTYTEDKAVSDGAISNLNGYISDWAFKNSSNETDYTYINGGKIKTGTIEADCLIGETLGAIRANLGEVTTGRIKSPNYDTGNGVMLDFTGGTTSDGLYVRSNTKNTTLKIDSDGTRVYGLDENTPVAEFVDTGVDCNKIEANTAELAGVLISKKVISETSYETWFTLA